MKSINLGHTGPIAFRPDDKSLACGGKFLRIWQIENDDDSRASEPWQDYPEFKDVHSLAYSPDGETLALGLGGGAIKLINPENRSIRQSDPGNTHGVHALTFTPDSRTLVSGSDDGRIRLLNVATGRELFSLNPAAARDFRSLLFSPDGKTLVAIAKGYQDQVLLWHSGTDNPSKIDKWQEP
jgi:WD40 repeat protein